MENVAIIVSIFAALSGVVLGWLGKTKATKKEIKEETRTGTELHYDVQYIKRGVEDIRFEQKQQGQRFEALSERVTRVEESLKQAHLRLNRLDGGRRE